jgi:mono/diheme cytochrome c family protein
MRKIILASVASLAAGCAFVAAAEPQSQDQLVREGHAVAQNVCAACHAVAPGEAPGYALTPQPKPFADIARDPHMTAQSIHRFITTTHWDEHTLPMTMPNPMLLDEEAGAVTAYILSLRKKP